MQAFPVDPLVADIDVHAGDRLADELLVVHFLIAGLVLEQGDHRVVIAADGQHVTLPDDDLERRRILLPIRL